MERCLLKKVEHRVSSVQQRYRKSGVLSMQIIACLLASGTQLGLRRMSDSAADNPSLSLDRLKTIFKNHFRPLTIKKATECLVNATKALPVFKHFQMEREPTPSKRSEPTPTSPDRTEL